MVKSKYRPVTYKVKGNGEFPKDMLRYDGSRAATPEDQAKIDWTFGDDAPPGTGVLYMRTVTLVNDSPPIRLWEPCYDRWRSFTWAVVEE